MNRIVSALLLFALLAFSSPAQAQLIASDSQLVQARGVFAQRDVRISPDNRERNWLGPQREGSCVHASMVMLLREQGWPEMAEWWRKTYSDGETFSSITAKLEYAKVPYAYTYGDKNVQWLRWACDNKLGAGVVIYGGGHMVIVWEYRLDASGQAVYHIIDNNRPGKDYWIPEKALLRDWFASGSWAITPVLKSVPPAP